MEYFDAAQNINLICRAQCRDPANISFPVNDWINWVWEKDLANCHFGIVFRA